MTGVTKKKVKLSPLAKKPTVPTENKFNDIFLKKMSESGLSESYRDYGLCVRHAPPWNQSKFPALPGIEIPYYDIDGKCTGFSRFRYIVDTRNDIERHTDKKALRYVQEPGSGVHIYIPPTVKWRELPADSAIVITEGEFKAACAVEYGFATIAVGGVYSFRDGSEELLHAELMELGLKGRTVYICYDSDAKFNSDVIRAENRLAECLLQVDASPVVVRLPQLVLGEKCGLDDFLVGGGDFQKVLDEAEAYGPWAALAKLNERFCLVQNPLCVVDLDDHDKKMDPGKFVAYHYGHLKHNVTLVTPKGDIRTAQVRTAKSWVEWGGRREARTISYKPGEPRIATDGSINDWRGWGLEPEKGDVSLWHQFMEYIFKGCPHEYRQWFERWLAYPLQHPGAKLLSACVFWGTTQGTGKSMVGDVLSKIYGDNAAKLDNSSLEDARNEWAVNKQFAFGDEITGSDKRGQADRLKGLITQNSIRVNIKYVPSYAIPDCINYYFTSNHPDAFYMDTGDRRFFIHEVTGPKNTMEFYGKFCAWWREGPGAQNLFHYLLSLDLGDFNPAAPPPLTEAKMQMIGLGRSDLGDWVAMVREAPDSVLRIGNVVLNYALWSANDLITLYDPEGDGKVTANGLSRELRRQGFQQAALGRPIACVDGIQRRLWVIRPDKIPEATYASQTVMSKLYDSERNSKAPSNKAKGAK